MTYAFRQARRSEAKPLIGIHSESGAGKTYSALVLARGFVGPSGRIGMIETESGRGESYADPAEYPEIGGYEVLSLRDSFSPRDYGEAITAAEKERFDALIIDSASHEWEGTGGVLDMAAKNQDAGKKGVQVWQTPKIEHARNFMLRFMQTPIPLVILCMRSKYPMKQITKPGSRDKEWVRSEELEPKQSDDILFEMFLHGWCDQQHNFHIGKATNRALYEVFEDNKPITAQTGARLAAWASQRTAPATTETNIDSLKAQAEDVASFGVDRLQQYWKGLWPSRQRLLEPFKEDLKKMATAADEASAEL